MPQSRSYRPYTTWMLTVLTVASFVIIGCPAPPDTGGVIKGMLIANREFVRRAEVIPLPDIEVHITDAATDAAVASTRTNVDGRFESPHLSPGQYKVCWKADSWIEDCFGQPVTVKSMNVGINMVEIAAKTGPGLQSLSGSVTLADGSSCVYRDGELTPGDVASIHLLDAGSNPVSAPIRTNRGGTFAVVVDTAVVNSVRAECGTATGFGAVPGGAVAQLDLQIKDHSPQVVSLAAYQGGSMVRTAPAGAAVELRVDARDRDGDALAASWTVTGGSVTPTTNLTASWNLPPVAGTYIASTTVTRAEAAGGGARAEDLLYFRVGPPIVHFGGTAKSEAGVPLVHLRVTVDGTALATDAAGRFFGSLPPDPDGLYVLDIRADAHVPVSEVLTRGTLGAVYTLQAAEQRTFPAGESVTLRGENGNFTVHLAGGSLVRADGTPAAGPVTATYALLDPTQRALPADYAATQNGGDEAYLDSYGAVYVGLEDGGGNKLNLAPTATSEVTFPVPAAFAGAPPSQIPIWSYDETAGTWREEPGVTAKLNGSAYSATVKHFSFVNMDIATGAAACMRVKPVFQQLPSPSPRLRVTAPQGNGGTKTKLLSLDDPINAVFRLLPNQPVKLEVIDQGGVVFADLRVTNDAGVPLNANAVDPGDDIVPLFDPMTWDGQYRPPEPYVECDSTVVLMSTSPNYQNSVFGFLSYEGAQVVFDGDCSDGACDPGAKEAEAYLKLIDPDDRVTNLGDWWAENGFDSTSGLAADQVEAAYLNAGDLGSGRNMRCRADAERVACYVGNYGAFDLQPGNADLAATANQADAFATVCMEYAPVKDNNGFVDINGGGISAADRIVKFFVYAGGDPAAPRVNAARLDNTYARYTPRICMACHGGELPSGELANAVLNANGTINMAGVNTTAALTAMTNDLSIFREFDEESFGAPTGGLDSSAIEQLNCNIVTQTPIPAAITQLINGWYANCAVPGTTFDATFVPGGWGTANQTAIYNGVVKPACRACHVAQERDTPDVSPDNDFDFDTFQDWADVQLPFIKAVVCNAYYMPHGEVPFNKLWFTLTPLGQGAATLESNPLTSFGTCKFTQ